MVTIVFFFVSSAFAQRSKCAIGNVDYACPGKSFTEIKLASKEYRAFKYESPDTGLIFYMGVPSGDFDPSIPGDIIMKAVLSPPQTFVWKPLAEPLEMSIKTKYSYELKSSFGLSDAKLIEVNAYISEVRGKRIIIGYVSDWSYDAGDVRLSMIANKALFDKGISLGGSAAGCNAVATVLNSVTKEFRKRDQYCSLFTTSVPK